jgi:signal transduction histidine kinase
VNFKLPFFSFLAIILLSSNSAIAQDAVIDLTHGDLNQLEMHSISGKWQFYWNQLLTPEDFVGKNHPGELISVPGSWNRQTEYPGLGFATYRTSIKLPPQSKGLAIYFPAINSAAKIWINGEKVAENGNATADKKFYKSKLTGIVLAVPPNASNLDLVVQVVNYTSLFGGFSDDPQLGSISALMSRLNQTQGINNFFAGSLIAMFIYQLILYSLFQRGKSYLWLALICLGVALRAMIVNGGSFLLPNLFPSVPWEVWKKIEFGSVYAIIAFFPLYIAKLFQHEAPQWPTKFFITISVLLCLMVLLTPHYVYGKYLDVAHAALILAFLYALYSAGKASGSGNEDARIIFIGIMVSFPFIALEMIKNSLLHHVDIQLMHLVETGVLVFLLFQVYLLANHFANSFKNLEQLNLGLEKMVDERTEQLTTANKMKEKLLSIVSHDIKSPLNSLRGILNMYTQKIITADEFKYYAKRIEDDLTKTSLLVDNILFWTANQLRGAKPKFEKIILEEIVNENIELFETIASAKKLSIKNELTKNHWVNFDRNILNLTLRNLISNAIKFSHAGDDIIIHGELMEKVSLIRIIDFGVGMSDEALKSLQGSQTMKSAEGTNNERGTGLGLSFCREYLQIAGGDLEIDSTPGKGSTLTISIPQKAFSANLFAVPLATQETL